MPNPTRRAATALVALLLAGPALAQPQPQPPAATSAPAEPSGATPAPAARPSQEEVQASLDAIGAADTRRLLSDRAYAAAMLGHLDRIAPYMSDDASAVHAVRNMRILALIALERPADVTPILDEIIALRPNEPGQYAAAWLAALNFRDLPRAVALIETASRAVPGVRWGTLRAMLDRQTVNGLLFALKNEAGNADRVRFADALFRIGWPGDGDTESADYIRSILIEDRLAAGEPAAARGYAEAISTLRNTVTLLLGRRYDPVLPANVDRLAILRTAIERQDRATSEALAGSPGDMLRLVDRSSYLRSLDRAEEALALVRPHLEDVPATAANGEHGMWVVMEGASALASLGRHEEALALMDRVALLPLADNPSLVSLRINHLGMLWEAGRNEEALRRADALDAQGDRFASDYGRAWIVAARICALGALGRSGETAPLVERLRGWDEINPAALSNAYLCLGDEAAAAALMVRRLGGSDPTTAIQALQDYTLGGDARGPSAALQQRTAAIRDRPEVRAALERVGHRLSLPLSRRYWVEY